MTKSIGTHRLIALSGAALSLTGFAVSVTLRVSSFARYMWYEDLGLDVDPAVSPELFRHIVAATPVDRAMFYIALALIPVGLLLLVLGVSRHRKPGG